MQTTHIMQGLDLSWTSADGKFVFLDTLSTENSSKTGDVLRDVERRIVESIKRLEQDHKRKALLILDNPDLMLATATAIAQQLNHLVLKLRSVVHSVIITCSADLPLLSAVEPDNTTTELENATASFITQQAHAARFVMSLRELGTGSAKDVSGVLRITRGESALELAGDEDNDLREMEALYLVQRDGNVKVFERGARSN